MGLLSWSAKKQDRMLPNTSPARLGQQIALQEAILAEQRRTNDLLEALLERQAPPARL